MISQVIDLYCQVKQSGHSYNCPANDETESVMNDERFKVIERSTTEEVVELADWLIDRGYNPVAEIWKMPNTSLFIQVMQWEPQTRTPN